MTQSQKAPKAALMSQILTDLQPANVMFEAVLGPVAGCVWMLTRVPVGVDLTRQQGSFAATLKNS